MTAFFASYARIQPWLANETPIGERERLQSVEERARLDDLVECILCASCHASCPMTQTDPGYLGPAILLKLDRFASDSRDLARADRVATADSERGVWRCHTALNCAEVCPKSLNPTESIAKLKRSAVWRRLTGRA
jgi:succinate dehydrogenase / fumarate reductase iron-sulfur subunit